MKLLKERYRKHQMRLGNDDAVPCFAKLRKIGLHAKALAYISVPSSGADASLLPVQPERIALNGGVEIAAVGFVASGGVGDMFARVATLYPREVTERAQRFKLDDYPADVENDGVNTLPCRYGNLPERGTIVPYEVESSESAIAAHKTAATKVTFCGLNVAIMGHLCKFASAIHCTERFLPL
jgi:hypothetical protein